MDNFIDGRRTDNSDAFFDHAAPWMVFFTTERTQTTEKEFIRIEFWIVFSVCAAGAVVIKSNRSKRLRAIYLAGRLNQRVLQKLYSMKFVFSNEIGVFSYKVHRNAAEIPKSGLKQSANLLNSTGVRKKRTLSQYPIIPVFSCHKQKERSERT